MEQQNQNQNQAADTEFSRCAVPLNQRKTYFSLTIVWTLSLIHILAYLSLQ